MYTLLRGVESAQETGVYTRHKGVRMTKDGHRGIHRTQGCTHNTGVYTEHMGVYRIHECTQVTGYPYPKRRIRFREVRNIDEFGSGNTDCKWINVIWSDTNITVNKYLVSYLPVHRYIFGQIHTRTYIL